MIRTRTEVNGQTVTNPVAQVAIKLFLGAVMFAVGAGLMYARHATLRDIRAARDWVEAPCVIERSEYVNDDDGNPILTMEFRYAYEGQSYRSDVLDLLPGRMGDDSSWEAQLRKQHPVGSETICYVDPDDPEHAVLDREHGSSGANNLRLLGFPFLFAGCAFWFSEALKIVAPRTRSRTDAAHPAPSVLDLPPPPRPVALGKALAFLLATPRMIQLAWAFFVGFVFVFRILEGPAMLLDLLPSDTIQVEGAITRVVPLDSYEFNQRVYEFEFDFDVEGVSHTGKSHTRGLDYEEGDRVEIVVDPGRPDSAYIAGSRRREVPMWVALLFGAPVPLLAFGIVACYVFNFRSVALLRNGGVATATREDGPSPLGRGDEPDPYAGLPKFVFEVDGAKHRVDPRSHVPSDRENVTVLYDPRFPQRSLGLNVHQMAILLGGKSAWYAVGASLIVPGVCVSAVCWLLGWS